MNNYFVMVPTTGKTVPVPYSSPPLLSPSDSQALQAEIKTLLVVRNAVLISHYYTSPEIQDISDETGGCVADSLEMARFGRDHSAQVLVVSGVRFMGESAKILSPHKTVVMPNLDATCSLDVGCPEDAFKTFCAQHPDREIVVYANTSAPIKAMADWVVTSSIAVDLIAHLHGQGKKIIWAPDKHLGTYLQQKTGADMAIWQGSCVVHDEFKGLELAALKGQYPEAQVLVHPESPQAVIKEANFVGSTSQLLHYAKQSQASIFIVATDSGILHKMRTNAPTKVFLEAPTAGASATCKSCAQCPWMAMNDLLGLRNALLKLEPRIELEEGIRKAAALSLEKMLAFSQGLKQAPHVPDLGAV